MSRIYSCGVPEATHGVVHLIRHRQLVTQQSVSVGEVGFDLNGSLKEFNRSFMLLLQRKTIAGHTPGLCRLLIEFNQLLS